VHNLVCLTPWRTCYVFVVTLPLAPMSASSQSFCFWVTFLCIAPSSVSSPLSSSTISHRLLCGSLTVLLTVLYSKLNAALRSSFDCQVAMNLSSTKSELLPSVSKSFGVKLCHISRLFWPDCKPEGPLFSAEFVCLSVCVCVFRTGTSTLQRWPILMKLGHKDPTVI